MAWADGHRAPKKDRGYGYAYEAAQSATATGLRHTVCAMRPPMLKGQELHLDHADWDRSKLLGFSHKACNLRAAAKKARAIQLYGKRTKTDAHRW